MTIGGRGGQEREGRDRMWSRVEGSFPVQWLLLGVALLLLGVALMYNLAKSKADLLAGERLRLHTQARVINDNLAQQLEGTDRALLSIRDELRGRPAAQWSLAVSTRRLKALDDVMPGVRTLFVADSRGIIRLSDRKEIIGYDLGQREYFHQAREHPDTDTLFVSKPYKTILGAWVMNLTRVIPGRNNEFSGIVVATLDPDFFKTLLGSVNYAPDMAASVVHGDGMQFLVVPEQEAGAGGSLAQSGSFFARHRESGRDENLFTGAAGKARIVVLRTIRPASVPLDKPMVAVVGRDLSAITSGWRKDALSQGAIFGIIALTSFAALAAFQRRQGAHHRQMEITNVRLRESEARFRRLFEDTAEAVLLMEGGRFIDCNRAALAMLRRESVDEVRGLSPDRISPEYQPDGRPSGQKSAALLAAAFEQGNQLFEWEHVRADGEHFFVEVLLTPILSRDRQLLHVVWRDIGERKRAESLLRARVRLNDIARERSLDDMMQAALDEAEALTNSTIGFFHFLGEDQTTLQLQAWSTNTIGSMCTAEGKGKHYPVSAAGVWADCIRERKPIIHNDYRGLPNRRGLPEGHAPVIREVVVPVVRYNRIDVIMGVGNKARDYTQKDVDTLTTLAAAASDIVLRKRAEEMLAHMAAIVQSSDDAIISKTIDGVITSWNPGAEKLFGYGAEEVIGRSMAMLFPPDRAAEERDILSRIARGERVEHVETVRIRKDAQWVDVSAAISPIKDQDGTIIGASTIARDITERKRAEARLKQVMFELERSNRDLEQFAYVASHDLQEPLRKVASFTELLEKRYRGKLDEKADTYVAYIVDGARRMQMLIKDLLAYSRITTRSQGFVKNDCNAVLGRVLKDIDVVIHESGASITADPLPTVPGDETQLGQLFQNLVGNAVKYHGDAAPRVHISAVRKDAEWEFSVKDNGIGIPMEYAERIFVIFQRLHTRTEYSGTGIGLAVCKKIVERHGGRIWVESEPGRGSIFYFTLPAE